MGITELLFVAVGLSMDAFTVAMCKGLCMKRVRHGDTIIIASMFGLFQAVMPCIGYFLAAGFSEKIRAFDHWAALLLLGAIGFNMIKDAVNDKEIGVRLNRTSFKELLALSAATSIDALVVGVGFALLDVNIVFTACIIGAVTFFLSLAGVCTGYLFGARFEKKAEITGGIILIIIGIKTAVSHVIQI